MAVSQTAPSTVVPARRVLPPITGLVPTTKTLGTLDPPNKPPLMADDAVTVPPANEVDALMGTGERWEAGIRFYPENVIGAASYGPCGDATKVIGSNLPIVDFIPFGVWAGDKCSAFGWGAHDFVGRATRLLLAAESKQIAYEFWTGARARDQGWLNLFLARTGTHSVTSAAVDPAPALHCLEKGIADCGTGAQSMIHCTRDTASAWREHQLLERDPLTGLVTTINGTVVVADAGYDGSGPGNVARSGGHCWAYATSNYVEVRRSEVKVVPRSFSEAMIRGTNDIEWRAERMAAATIDGACVMAAEINLPLCAAEGS